MYRRRFLALLGLAPLAAVAGLTRGIEAAAALPGLPTVFRRVSCIKGDPGERAYGMICGDHKTVKVFLDGVEQRHALTADVDDGFVDRYVSTEQGNIAVNPMRSEALQERVYGRVEIRIVDRPEYQVYRGVEQPGSSVGS